MTPIVNGLAEEYGDQVTFTGYDVTSPQGRELAQAYRVRGHPTLILLDGTGNVIWQGLGEVSKEALEGILAKAVRAP